MSEKEHGIFAVSECWLNSSVTNAEVEIEGYKLLGSTALNIVPVVS